MYESPARLFYESRQGISSKPNRLARGFYCYIFYIWSLDHVHVNLNYVCMCYCACYVVFLLIWNSSTVLYSKFEVEREDLFHVVKLSAIFYLFLSFPLFYYRTNKPSHFFRIREPSAWVVSRDIEKSYIV
jgi:hypothetical protein